jgi:quercetin dioxygenase-like cupin family protein
MRAGSLFRVIRFRTLLLVSLIVLGACAKGTPTNPILPPGVSPTPLQQPAYVGLGKYEKLAEFTSPAFRSGVPFVSFVEVRQASGAIFAHQDDPGFLYSVQGDAVVMKNDEEGQTINQTTAAWVSTGREHRNPTGKELVWYFIGQRSIVARGAQLIYPTYRILYSSPDLPTPPAKPLVHQLGLITLEKGGRTSSHSHDGSESFYVMQGTIELALNDGTRKKISAGDGGSVRPGVVMQIHVVGDDPVRILTYFVTPEGGNWQNNLQTLP